MGQLSDEPLRKDETRPTAVIHYTPFKMPLTLEKHFIP